MSRNNQLGISRRKFLAGSGALALAASIGRAKAQIVSRPFASSSPWNTLVPSGSIYGGPLAWPTATGFNYSVAWDSYSPGVYVENLSDPLCAVVYDGSWGYPPGTLNIHLPHGVTGAPGTDEELLVIGLDGNVYDFEGFSRTDDNNATASFLAWCAFTDSGFGTTSPFLGAGVNAIGANQLGGLINDRDQTRLASSLPFDHGISIALDGPLLAAGFNSPAIASDVTPGSVGIGVQEGQLLAIPPTTSIPALSFDGMPISALGAAVFTAMQKYGARVIDQAVGDSAISMQFNAWSAPPVIRMVQDIQVIMPLLESFSGGGGVRPPQMSLLGVGP